MPDFISVKDEMPLVVHHHLLVLVVFVSLLLFRKKRPRIKEELLRYLRSLESGTKPLQDAAGRRE